MGKIKPRYDAGYPLAIELVYAQRLGDNARQFGLWVRNACIKTHKAIGSSGAIINTDAADGKDVSVDDVLGDFLKEQTVKKARVYIRHKYGNTFSRMTREKQESLIQSVVEELAPVDSPFIKAMPDLLKDGMYGAVPAFIISEVRRQAAIDLANDVAKVTGTKPDLHIRAINHVADSVQIAIKEAQFGLTSDYWDGYYQRYHIDRVPLTSLKTGLPVTADTSGAASPVLDKLSAPLREISAIPSIAATNTAHAELTQSAVDDFRLIIRAAADTELAPGVTIPRENKADLISVDIYDGDKKLFKQTDDWLSETMGRMEGVSDDALQRGISVVQQGLREGRGNDYIADKLATEMEIPFRRARNVARNEIGNHAWNLQEANARIGGMTIYRWRGMLDEVERKLHVDREGQPYQPDKPPIDGNPGQPHGCRCFPEWLFSAADVAKAEKEIAARNTGKH